MESIYRYHSTGHSPKFWLFLVFISLCVVGLETSSIAPPLVGRLLLWGLLGAVMLILISNPTWGITLSNTELSIENRKGTRVIHLSEIDHLSVKESGALWGFRYIFHMNDAKPVEVSSACFPSARKIAKELEARGVTVKIKTFLGF